MGWTDAIEDRWGGRHGTVRLLLRLFGLGVFGYALVEVGAFSGSLWVALGTALALVLTLALLIIRVVRPFGPFAIVLITALMVLGVVLNPGIDHLGSVFFVLGGIMLVGQPEVSFRLGMGITAVLTVALVVRAVLADPQWSVLLSNLFGAVAVVLLGLNRRQRVLRLRETARASELEERGRIAGELHDVLAHSLGGLVVQLDAADAELESGRTSEAAARIRVSRQLAVDGLREARLAVEQLRTGARRPAPQGLVDVVDAVDTVVRGPVGVQLGAELEVVGEPRPVDAAVAEALVATAREGLTNANKHAPGARVSAALLFAPATVRLEVVNGLPDAATQISDLAGTGGGAGLTGLSDRIGAAGGRLQAGRERGRWVLSAECPAPLTTTSPTTRSSAAEPEAAR